MGLIHTEVELSNPGNRALAALRVVALVDTGPITLCIPEHVAVQLSLSELERREGDDGDREPRLGSLCRACAGRLPKPGPASPGALVLGESVLLGAIPLEDMDLVINPRMQQVTVNPESPNFPSAVVVTPAR